MTRGSTRLGRFLALVGASTLLAGLGGCGHRNDDINKVQPGYVKKSVFQSGHEWLYRRTLVSSEVTNAIAWEGMGTGPLERIRFRIEEDQLVAYRSYAAIPGSETDTYEGRGDYFTGAVVSAWPIVSHFDIIRGYDTTTGNESNVISENSSDRPWSEREYMRVDWSRNLVEMGENTGSDVGWLVNVLSTGKYWADLDTRPTDPFASRFQDDYIEINENVFLAMDIYSCAEFTGFLPSGYQLCGFGEAKLRHALSRITEESDYIPRDFPDSVTVKGADGKEVYDPVTGEVKREPIFDRFGYFRQELLTYDRGYTTTESGRLYRANIFNIWERHTDENGNVLPYSARTPKPIIYYLNYDYPQRWRQAAAEVAAEYNRVFKSMVGDLQGKPADQVPDMFEIRDNDCNIANVKSFVSSNPDLEFAVARAVCPEDEACSAPLDRLGVGNLAEACTSLEAATRDPATGKPQFDWQRAGDPRYHMVHYLMSAQQSSWGGYGPNHPDVLTGEVHSANAWIRGMWYEMVAASVLDVIDLMNDKKSIEEIIYGQDVRRQINASIVKGRQMMSERASEGFVDQIKGRITSRGTTKQELLREVDPNHQMNRIKRVEGTRIETDYLTDPMFQKLFSGPQHPDDEEFSEEVTEMSRPVGLLEKGVPLSPRRRNALYKLSSAGFCFLDKQDVDPYYESLAFLLKDWDRDQAYEYIVNNLIKHVMLHELGHNFGLRHNFEGTYDALNYYDEFWRYNWASEQDKLANHYDVRRNSSVMEYVPNKSRMFSTRLGRYDEAALRFGYANQVETFTNPNVVGGDTMKTWRYLNDYTKIPDYLCGAGGCPDGQTAYNAITSRQWVNFDPQSPPANEVPYLFCSDEYAYWYKTPFCATGDFGSNVREIFANYYVVWSGYFFFNNFARERLGWDPSGALMPAVNAMSYITLVGQWLYYYTALDDSFANTDLGEDMVTAVAQGLNMAAEMMSTPEPMRMCEDTGVFMPWYFFRDCDERAPLNSQYALDAKMIQLPLGPGRPAALGFSEEFVDWNWSFVGSYFDKANLLWLLGMYEPTFYRFNYDLDIRTYDISLYRLFETELRDFYQKLVTLNTYVVRFGDIIELAQGLGSYWCRESADPNAPAHLGHFEPRRLIDPVQGVSLPGPTASCYQPASIYPRILSNIPYNAMFYAYALFSSPFDSQMDLSRSQKIFVVGSDDEFVDWRSLPPAEICSVQDDLTGLEYRAVRQSAGTGESLGCLFIDKARQAQEDYHTDEGSDYFHDRWRAWFERLEFARDLARIFDY